MSRDSIKIAIIGAGAIGPRHAQAVLKCPSATLVCFVDPNPSSIKVSQTFKVPLFTSIQELLASDHEIDAAVVSTPNDTHVPISLQLLAANIHLLIEKPLCTTSVCGHDLVAASAAAASNVKVLVGHHRRFNPYITATKRALSSGLIGRPIAINGLWTLFKPPSYYQPPSEWHARADAGGPILINLIHDIDILHFLFGPIDRVHAMPTRRQRAHAGLSHADTAEEGAAILFHFASGVVGTFLLCDSVPSPHSFEAGTGENPSIPQTGKDFYRIFGSEGCLSVPDLTVTKYAAGAEKGWSSRLEESRLEVGSEVPFETQMNHFCEVVRGNGKPMCTVGEGLAAVEVAEAVKRAMKEGGAVDVRGQSARS